VDPLKPELVNSQQRLRTDQQPLLNFKKKRALSCAQQAADAGRNDLHTHHFCLAWFLRMDRRNKAFQASLHA
jgi:hypothetical protein